MAQYLLVIVSTRRLDKVSVLVRKFPSEAEAVVQVDEARFRCFGLSELLLRC